MPKNTRRGKGRNPHVQNNTSRNTSKSERNVPRKNKNENQFKNDSATVTNNRSPNRGKNGNRSESTSSEISNKNPNRGKNGNRSESTSSEISNKNLKEDIKNPFDDVFLENNGPKKKSIAEVKEAQHDWSLFVASLTLYQEYHRLRSKKEENKEDTDESDEVSESSSTDESESEHAAKSLRNKQLSFLERRKVYRSFCRKKKMRKLRLAKKEETPPNSFRNLPIFPTKYDIINKTPFIRPNIVGGKYEDVEHYLDVHFRLFREDYIASIREGIEEYWKDIEEFGCTKKTKNKIYQNVKVLNPEVNDFCGVAHILQFEPFPPSYKWNNKRLQEGTLVCLSPDNFKEDFIFASVVDRTPENIKLGRIKVCFEKKYQFIYETLLNVPCTMLEPSAYFESYRHTLSILKEFDEDSLPLKDYIIGHKKKVSPPSYLEEGSIYDFTPLLQDEYNLEEARKERELEKSDIEQQPAPSVCLKNNQWSLSDSDEDLKIDNKARTAHQMKKNNHVKSNWSSSGSDVETSVYTKSKQVPQSKGDGWTSSDEDDDVEINNQEPTADNAENTIAYDVNSLREVPVLKTDKWPSKEVLKLDDSQYEVLKAALGKEFTIIQGPPGTGKTYMGLQIVKLLLHNSHVWYPEKYERDYPILIVCYTNHALDQFLERILKFTKKIARVGRQGDSEVLEPYNLATLRSNKYMVTLPKSHDSKRTRLKKKKSVIESLINTYLFIIEAAVTMIYPCSILQKYIGKKQYDSLLSGCFIDNYDIRFIMEVWLDVPCSEDIKTNFFQDIQDSPMDINEICSWLQNYGEARRDLDSLWNEDTSKIHEEYIRKKMKNVEMMNETEARAVESVWELSSDDRWRLYRYWVTGFNAFVVGEMKKCQMIYVRTVKALWEHTTERDVNILQNACVVGMTCTGAAKFYNLIEGMEPQIVIVEEAAEVLESHLVTSLAKSMKHLILIGDHQQLRPLPTIHELANQCNLDISLFERMIKRHVECYTLTKQHRMLPCIAQLLVPHIYKRLDSHESVYEYEDIIGVEKSMYFISHNNVEMSTGTCTFSNKYEAKMLIALAKYFLFQDYKPDQITILAAYAGQVEMLCSEQVEQAEDSKCVDLTQIKVTTIDNYQGEENDIILVSFVRSNYECNIGFLKTTNRICVALSRARKGLFCVGNFEFLALQADFWEKVTNDLKEQRAVGPSLNLICQIHKCISTIESPNDFKNKVPDGGCSEKCGVQLKCGHTCKRCCHPNDKNHENYICEEKCNKKCDYGHPCRKKCHEECGDCKVVRFEKLPNCGHFYPVPCYEQDLAKFNCPADCEKMLPCGHICQKKCTEDCEPCLVVVPKSFPDCKHTIRLKCFEKIEDIRCPMPCTHFLPCQHPCPGQCGDDSCPTNCPRTVAVQLPCGHITNIICSEREESLYKPCRASCDEKLPCGHRCPGDCYRCNQGRGHVCCWSTCRKLVNGQATCKLSCGHDGACNMHYIARKSNSKSSNDDWRTTPSSYPGIREDRRIVNKWKTDYCYEN